MEHQSPKRRLLRYHSLPLPVDHIYIHSALNQIGKKRFPGIWGIGPAWSQRAFRVVRLKSGDKSIVRYELDRPNKQFKRINRALPEGNVLKRSAGAKIFVAMFSLLDAITSGAVKAYHMTIDDKPARIPPNSMHWVKRRREILHTGYVLADRGDGQRDFLEVLLSRTDLERWLSKDGSKKESSSKYTFLRDDLVEAFLAEFCRVSAEHGNFRFTEDPLWQMVKYDLPPHIRIQKTIFDRKIYQQLPESVRQTVGAPRKGDQEAFDKIKDQLVLDLKKIAVRVQEVPVVE